MITLTDNFRTFCILCTESLKCFLTDCNCDAKDVTFQLNDFKM